MTYVLDSCVALRWFLAEPDSAKAVRIPDEFHRGIHELLVPDENRAGGHSDDERKEWERYQYIEHLVRMARARATQRQCQG